MDISAYRQYLLENEKAAERIRCIVMRRNTIKKRVK